MRSDHDLPKCVRGIEALGKSHCVGEFRSGRGGFGTQFSSRYDHILLVDGLDDLRNRQSHFREAVGLDPDAHGIIRGSQDVYPPNALDPGQLVLDVDQGVVAQEFLIVSSVRGESDEHQDVRKRLLSGNSILLDRFRKLGRCG